MQVNEQRINNQPIDRIIFTDTGDEDFKTEIRNWLREHYPSLTPTNILERMEFFAHGQFIINVEGVIP